MFLHLFIISRSGGLIYNKDLSASAPKLSVNGWLIMGSTFHGLHSIAAQVGKRCGLTPCLSIDPTGPVHQ